MTLLTKANTFFLKKKNKALALYLSQEQKSVSTDRNWFHLQNPLFLPTYFPLRPTPQDGFVHQLPRGKEDKGLRTPQVCSPNYHNRHFFF